MFSQTSSPINVLLTHLSAVDLTVCIAVLVCVVPETFNQDEQVAPWLCPVHGFLFSFLHPMAIWTVCGLNCDRSADDSFDVIRIKSIQTRAYTSDKLQFTSFIVYLEQIF